MFLRICHIHFTLNYSHFYQENSINYLQVRSQSESDALNRLGVINSRTTLTEQLKKRQLIPITVEKSLDNAGKLLYH